MKKINMELTFQWGRLIIGSAILKYYFFNLFFAVLGLHSCTRTFSSCGKRGLLSSCSSQGFSLQGLHFLWSTGCRHMNFSTFSPWALKPGLSSRGTRA